MLDPKVHDNQWICIPVSKKSMQIFKSGGHEHEIHENHRIWTPESKRSHWSIQENQIPMQIPQSGTHNHEIYESQQIWNPKSRKTHASGFQNIWNQCKSMTLDPRIHEIHKNPWVLRQLEGWTAMQIVAKAIENSKYHKETQPFTYTFSSKLPPPPL